MTQKQFEVTLLRAVEDATQLVRAIAPVRSGKLKASIELVATEKGYKILITAPHTVYTEEKWVSPRWKGRANPNEGWIKEATELVYRLLKARLKGTGVVIGG